MHINQFEYFYILDTTEYYQLVGTGKTCSEDSIYTNKGCNGFSGTSLEECKEKCSWNDNPTDCPNSNVCKYIIWEPMKNVCHFASDSCNEILTGGGQPSRQLWVKHNGYSSESNCFTNFLIQSIL